MSAMTTPLPSVGRDVHYVSHGSAVQPDGSQKYASSCVAAKITEVGGPHPEPGFVGLIVFNPAGAVLPLARHGRLPV